MLAGNFNLGVVFSNIVKFYSDGLTNTFKEPTHTEQRDLA